jgi:hypothetical protein
MAVIPAARLARARWWPGVAAWALWALTLLGLAIIAWLDQLSRQAGRPDVTQLGGGLVQGPVMGLMSATTVGRCWPAAGPATRSAGCCWPLGCP